MLVLGIGLLDFSSPIVDCWTPRVAGVVTGQWTAELYVAGVATVQCTAELYVAGVATVQLTN